MIPSGPQLPLFYKAPVPLTFERHRGRSLMPVADYRFAAKSNAIPVTADEFWLAARHYPIVFTKGEVPLPVVLVGMRAEENLFVDGAGQWDGGAFVPGYVRRYPFVFMTGGQDGRFVLCVDEQSGLVQAGEERPLYRDGKPSEVVNEALRFCADYQQRHAVTLEFTRAMAREGMFIERAARIALANGQQTNLTGFAIIDDKKLDELPNRTFLDWRRKGWLPLIYCHIVSLQSWSALIDRASAEG